MTDGSKSGTKSGIRKWREVFHKLNAGAELPLGEPNLVYNTLDDAILVQTHVWLIPIAKFLSYSQKQYIDRYAKVLTRYTKPKPSLSLSILFNSIITGDFESIGRFN